MASLPRISDDVEPLLQDVEFVSELVTLASKWKVFGETVLLLFKHEKYYQQNYQIASSIVGETVLIEELTKSQLIPVSK
jgi:hypothetical protein